MEIGLNLIVLGRKKANQKGIAERNFRTFNEEVLHPFRGTTFSNVLERGDYDSVGNAVITLNELQEIVHIFIVDIFNQNKHSGIRDVPLRRWDELTNRHPINPVESIDQIEPLLGRVGRVKLRREGVQFQYLQFISDELVAERRTNGFRKKCPTRR